MFRALRPKGHCEPSFSRFFELPDHPAHIALRGKPILLVGRSEMIASSDRLKKIDDNTLQETVPSRAGSSPLEWRREFNGIKLSLSNINICTEISVNEVDIIANKLKKKSRASIDNSPVFEEIGPNLITTRSVTGNCLDCHDILYRLIQDDDGSSSYRREKIADNIQVGIKECKEEPRQDEDYVNGVYCGEIYHCGPKENDFGIFCLIPSSQMDGLIKSIASNPLSSIDMNVAILSFQNEMERTFNEGWMQKNLLIKNSSAALITSLKILSVPNVSTSYNQESAGDRVGFWTVIFAPSQVGLKRLLAEMLKVIWVIAIILIIYLIKRP